MNAGKATDKECLPPKEERNKHEESLSAELFQWDGDHIMNVNEKQSSAPSQTPRLQSLDDVEHYGAKESTLLLAHRMKLTRRFKPSASLQMEKSRRFQTNSNAVSRRLEIAAALTEAASLDIISLIGTIPNGRCTSCEASLQ
jgi:hypothetical protein